MSLVIKKSRYLKHQWEFLRCGNIRYLALVAGYGSGKTYAFLRKCLLNHLYKKDNTGKSHGWVIYPTLKLARELFVDDFRTLLSAIGIQHKYYKADMLFQTGFGTIAIHSMEYPERLVGKNTTWVGSDEFDVTKLDRGYDVFLKIVARLRGCENAQFFIATTPEGFNTTHKIMVKENDKYSSTKRHLIHAKTTDNPYLPKDFIQSLKDTYDERLLKAYLNGEFVNLKSGSVYRNFNRENHVIPHIEYDKNLPLRICFDFNVFPFSVVFAQHKNENDIRFIGEIRTRYYSDTEEVCHQIINKFDKDWDVKIYGDASGISKSTKSNLSDYEIIDNVFRPHFRTVEYFIPKSNPSVKDRINCFNLLLNKNKITFNEQDCKYLIEDMEQVIYDKKGDIDKTNQEITHLSDGAGYYTTYEFPVIKPKLYKTKTR